MTEKLAELHPRWSFLRSPPVPVLLVTDFWAGLLLWSTGGGSHVVVHEHAWFNMDELQWQMLCWVRQLQRSPQVVELARKLGDSRLTPNVQQFMLQKCFFDPVLQAHSPGNQYLGRLAKQLVLAAEEDEEEIDEQLLALFTTLYLLPLDDKALQPPETSAGWCHKTFAYCPAQTAQCLQPSVSNLTSFKQREVQQFQSLSGNSQMGLISLHMSNNLSEGGTGCHAWEAGFCLSEYILSNPKLFAGREVLEIGSGTGVVGICLSRIGATSITLTDGDVASVANCTQNLQLNGVELGSEQGTAPKVQCLEVKWEDEDAWSALHPDIVLGADVCYDAESIPVLVFMLQSFLATHAQRRNGIAGCGESQALGIQMGQEANSQAVPAAYIATTIRNEATFQLFLEALAAVSLNVEDLSSQLLAPSIEFEHHLSLTDRTRFKLHRICRRQ